MHIEKKVKAQFYPFFLHLKHMLFFLSALWWRRGRGLWKLPDGRDWLRGKLGLVLMGGAMFSKSLNQYSVDGWGCVPSLLFTWGQTVVDFPCGSAGKESAYNVGDLGSIPGLGRSPRERKGYPLQYSGLKSPVDYSPQGRKESETTERVSNYGGGSEDNSNLQKVPCRHCYIQCSCQPCSRPPPTPPPETPGHLQVSLDQSLVGSLLLSSGSWCAQGSVCALWSPVSPVPCKFWWLYDAVNGNLLHEILCHTPSMIGNNKKTGDVTQISRCLEPGKIGRWSKVSLLLHLAMVR